MKISKKEFQIWNGVQKSLMKHVPHALKENFQKKLKFWSFSKKGGSGVQKMKILKKYFQIQKGLQKMDIKHVSYAPKQDF